MGAKFEVNIETDEFCWMPSDFCLKEKVAGGTGGAGGALAPPVFWEKDTKITLKFALSEAAIYLAPPDFSTLRRPCAVYFT